ncbi:hypothetical protein PAAG_05814 [Paracoccidioides lutzii Pb01]|uniref:Extracellular proline-serine rich protein n=1 Tax=Paracoccidioides lutzii (strain ATCC MYA-826 / Pb01) TaxID=502779 RepID=C1H4X3_PARBA|nr:hypothetical protein PAAG_05814 [Paracoccidioides lutzii Pb01]EEH34767.1 hypothetical protein PAAG_05814 [Paracoccidioides lutzii Pb01]
MKLSVTLLAAALAEIVFALPGGFLTTPYPTSSSSVAPQTTVSVGLTPPALTYSLHVTNVSAITVIYTTTDTVTTTSFVPRSSPVVLDGVSTYYSTWLTMSIGETTTYYIVSSTLMPSSTTPTLPASDPPSTSGDPQGPPAPTVTVTHSMTVTESSHACGATSSEDSVQSQTSPTSDCENCQTIIYTEIETSAKTIVVPMTTSKSSTSRRYLPSGHSVSSMHPDSTGDPTSTEHPVSTQPPAS